MILRRPGHSASLSDITCISSSLGVETNPIKNHEFNFEQQYVGFIWNTRDHTVRLPVEKLSERKKLIKDLLVQESSWAYHTIESAIGKMVHTVYLVPHMRAYMRSLYRWLKDWTNKAARRRTPENVQSDLKEWEQCLDTFDSRPLIPSPTAVDVAWVGDASSSFGIGVLVGRHWACFELAKDWQTKNLVDDKRSIAWAKTVAIRLGLLVLTKTRRVAG